MEYYRDSIVRTFWTLTLGSLLVGVLVGCQATPTVSEMEAEHHRLTNVIRQQLRQSKAGFLGASEARSVSPPQVNLQPGDEVEVKFYYTPELDITQMVRPDGNIALQLIGEVVVQGKTPGELREELLDSRLHLERETGIEVRSFAYPFGSFVSALGSKVENYGYQTAMGLGKKTLHDLNTIYYLDRITIYGTMTLEEFGALLNGSNKK